MNRRDVLVQAGCVELAELPAEPVYVGVERVDAADVLADVHPAEPDVREQSFERGDLLVGLVPSVVNDDVDGRDLRHEVLPERRVGLVSNENLDAVRGVGGAGRLDVYSV